MIINRSDALINAQFENDAINSVPSGTNGTWSGTEQYAASISGEAADFDGSSRVEFGNSGLSNSSSFTAFLRMNLDTHTTGDRILTKRDSGNNNGFWLTMNSSGTDTIRFMMRNGTDTAYVSRDLVLPETNLYAVRCELDMVADTFSLSSYSVDGSYATSSIAYTQNSYTSNAQNITVGDFSGGGDGMDGLIDDFTFIEGVCTDEDFYRYYLGLGITDL